MSFLTSWWSSPPPPPPPAPTISITADDDAPSISVSAEDDDDDDEQIPSFPMADSIQRASGKTALDLPPSTTKVPAKPRKKVALAPGHSMLDWARLKAESGDLRGVNGPQLLRVTLSELKKHNKRSDAWTAINGNVYNMTPFFGYHPGGDDELMRIAGRDGTRLFALTHGWVSADMMMGQETLVGFLVREQQS